MLKRICELVKNGNFYIFARHAQAYLRYILR